ncbi:MAG: hypothetical protein N0C84_01165 [Candidatus Thiodiazotropha taylori]|uniref:Neck protein n=1 Tax=Candidatus Thiodiazotropha taylori TaxID=2792791 RepID=A0A9E4K896_9GAMM|nr:hypothetical protein [Candidatus Thiodiazotropha taylori]MCW4255056.1 hypothetical protein [Candidatus Thiodiazotropha taylori]
MAKPRDKQEFADWILRNLGAPVINVEITDAQLEDVIDEAVTYYQDWHYEGTQRSYRVVCLDTEVFDGNNRRPQCVSAPYYNPDSDENYRVGDRVRATINKDQGERIWIKYDSEEQIDSFKYVEYPMGDWFKETGEDLHTLYDSDSHNINAYDSDTLGTFTKVNENFVKYDSETHVIRDYTVITDPVGPETDVDDWYILNADSEYISANNAYQFAQYKQTLGAPVDSEFTVSIKRTDGTFTEYNLNSLTKDTYKFYGTDISVSDSDGVGNELVPVDGLNGHSVEMTFRDSEAIITVFVHDSDIKSQVLEPIPYGDIFFQSTRSQKYIQTNNIVDDEHVINYDSDNNTYKVHRLNADGTMGPENTEVDGIFFGPNAKWVIRESGKDDFDSDDTLHFHTGSITDIDSEILDIPDYTENATHVIDLYIRDSDGVDPVKSATTGTTDFNNLKDFDLHYNTATTDITLVRKDGVEMIRGSGYINIIHPNEVANSTPGAVPVDLYFWKGVYQNELVVPVGDQKMTNEFYEPLATPMNIPLKKNGVLFSNIKVSTSQSYFPADSFINYVSAEDKYEIGTDVTGETVDSDLVTAKLTVDDPFELEDSDIFLAFLNGDRVTEGVIWPTNTDSEIGTHKLPLLLSSESKLDSEEYFKTFDLTMENTEDNNYTVVVDTHGLYERVLWDSDTIFYMKEDKQPSRFNSNTVLNGVRYIRLPQEAQKKYDFEDLWALEQAVLAEPELNLDYSKTGQVGIPIPEDIHSIVKVFRIPVSALGTTFGSFNYQLMMNQMGWYQATVGANWGFMTDLYIHMSYIELIEQQLNVQPAMRFNKHKNRLYIDTFWDRVERSGVEYLMLEVYEITDPEVFGNVYKDVWLKRYAAALAKMQWGSNLKKFAGTQLPGGIEVNGIDIYNEGKEEREALEEQVKGHSFEGDFFLG